MSKDGDMLYSCESAHYWTDRSGVIRPAFSSIPDAGATTDPRVCPGCGDEPVRVSRWGTDEWGRTGFHTVESVPVAGEQLELTV